MMGGRCIIATLWCYIYVCIYIYIYIYYMYIILYIGEYCVYEYILCILYNMYVFCMLYKYACCILNSYVCTYLPPPPLGASNRVLCTQYCCAYRKVLGNWLLDGAAYYFYVDGAAHYRTFILYYYRYYNIPTCNTVAQPQSAVQV
jgi:hypothetical protein